MNKFYRFFVSKKIIISFFCLYFAISLLCLSLELKPNTESLENIWYSTGFSLKITPANQQYFFFNNINSYLLKLFYQNSRYMNESSKDWHASGIYSESNIQMTKSVSLEARARYYLNRYDIESASGRTPTNIISASE